MALSASRLSGNIKSAFIASFGTPLDSIKLQAFCDDVANAIVNEITGNAVVHVASVSGVMTGGGSSGPGSGTVS